MRDKGDLEKPQKNIRKHHWKIRSILKLHRISLKIKIDSHVRGEKALQGHFGGERMYKFGIYHFPEIIFFYLN